MPGNVSSSLDLFSSSFKSIHGYAILVVCLIAMPLILINIIVLTRKRMLSSTNSILTALAISDFIIMLIHIPIGVKYHCIVETSIFEISNTTSSTKCDYFWTAYDLMFVHLNQTLHSTSIWLTVMLAIFRYIYVWHNKLGKRLCTRKNSNLAIIFTLFFCILISIPSYMCLKIKEIQGNNDDGSRKKYYKLTRTEYARRSDGLLFRSALFIQAFCIKLIPCILLIIFSSLLFYSVRKNPIINNTKKKFSVCSIRSEKEKLKEYRRTNIMLVLVCFLFFITEFPQGVLAIMSLIYHSKDFHSEIYMKFDDVIDIIALINNAINFILYCRMSSAFRRTFKDTFFKFGLSESKYKKIKNLLNS
jgi:hypothetical protein